MNVRVKAQTGLWTRLEQRLRLSRWVAFVELSCRDLLLLQGPEQGCADEHSLDYKLS